MKVPIALAVASLLLGAAAPLHAAGDAPRLGSPCEASAARVVACPKGRHAAACVLVGDNEIADRLFLYSADANGNLSGEAPVELVDRDGDASPKLDDIEAIEVDGERIWIVASHSRKRWRDEAPAGSDERCAVARRRLALFAGTWPPADGGTQLAGSVIETKKNAWQKQLRSKCAKQLFQLAGADVASRALADAACHAFATADERANQDRGACEQGFNIEGAAVIPGSDGQRRLWLGLRGPTLAGKALLLRWQGGDAFRFDGIAELDLGDARGVRDLAYAGGRLWALAGPTPDSSGVPFALEAVAVASLDSGAQLAATFVRSVREQSEGLAIFPDARHAVLVTDGEKGGSADAACRVPSTSFPVPLE